MSKVKQNIYSVLKGKFLVSPEAIGSWRVIVFFMILLMFMIFRSHVADQKVIRIAKLHKEIRELKAEFVDARTKVMRLELESSVQKKVAERGLFPSETPPKKIKVVSRK